MDNRPIGIFDSGVGGLSVLSACSEVMKSEDFIYLTDKSCMPYGNKPNAYIASRAGFLTETLFSMGCKSVIVACNTATAVAIDGIRRYYDLPIFGVEPAVLPAVKNWRGGKILVLVTCATARQDRFKRLIEKCDNGNIEILPLKNLATLIENNFNNLDAVREHIYLLLSPFKEVESVVLGCTHYCHVKSIINDFYSGKVRLYDSGTSLSRYVFCTLKAKNMLKEGENQGKIDIINV